MVQYNDDPIRAGRAAGFADDPAGAAACTTGANGDDRPSVGQLLKDLRDESGTLLRQEVALAKTEISEKVATAGRNAASIAVGGAVALAGLLFVLAAIAFGLYSLMTRTLDVSPGLAMWLAPLIVGVVVGLIGYAMVQKGLSTLKRMSPVPEKTVQTLKEDKQWLTNKVSA